MKYLHLDSGFAPFKESIQFDQFSFPGGEPHVRITDELNGEDEVTVTTRIKMFGAMGFLLVTVDALRRMGVQKISLVIPYFPAARQDRVMTNGEALTVKVFADLINSMELEQVIIFDPHSEVTPALLNKVKVISNHKFVKEALRNETNYVLVSPDGGALKKVYKLSEALGGIEVVECSKRRNVKTGKILDFAVYEDQLDGKTCVVVDDICDGGGTFIGLGKELKRKGAGRLILVVSHGIFSKPVDELSEIYDGIYTTDSFNRIDDERIKQIKLSEIELNYINIVLT